MEQWRCNSNSRYFKCGYIYGNGNRCKWMYKYMYSNLRRAKCGKLFNARNRSIM